MGFRPHGLHIDNVSQRVFAVSHSTLLREESIFVFDIHPSNASRIPELRFRYALTSSNFPWVDADNIYFLNDVAAVDGQNELYVTQFGPCPIKGPWPSEKEMKQKHLWRCTWDESRLSDHRVAADCRHAWPIKSFGLNGININPDSTRLWVNDLWMARLWVFDRHPDGRLVKASPDIYLPGLIDNVERDHASGDLTMGMFRNNEANNSVGGAIVLHTKDGKSAPTIADVQDSGTIYQVSTSLIYEQWTILGSPWDSGLMICRHS